MSHTLELSAALRDALWTTSPALLVPVVKFSGRVKIGTVQNTNGSWTFGAYEQVEDWDISDYVDAAAPPKFTFKKPVLPTSSGNLLQATQVKLTLLNPTGYIGAVQDEGILELSTIEKGIINISARVGTTGDEIQLFNGRIKGVPNEKRGKTIFTLIDAFWEALTKPVLFEDFGQNSYVNQYNVPVHDPFEIGTQSAGTFFKVFDAYTTFEGDGKPAFDVTRSAEGSIDILDIGVKKRSKPGKYTIEFISGFRYQVVYPNGGSEYGTTTTDFDVNQIELLADNWTGSAQSGDKIEFQVSWTAYGNFVTMCKNLLEKAFADNWGSLPGLALSQWPVEWSKFDTLETQFRSCKGWVSLTNKDNSVWLYNGSRPVDCLAAAQRCLNHIGATLLVTAEGKISVKSPYQGDDPIYEINQDYPIYDYEILAETKYNQITGNYGESGKRSGYSVNEVKEVGTITSTNTTPFTHNMPYFKEQISAFQADSILCLLIDKFLETPIGIKAVVAPAFAISVRPGDRFKITSNLQPKISSLYIEVKEISFPFGEKGTIKGRVTRDPEGTLPTVGAAEFCTTPIL